jgi:hypothetical protein
MPGPLQDMVQQLGLDDPTQPPAWSPDMLQGLSEQYPNFAQALDQNNIHLNITGPNIIGGPEPPQLSPEQMQQQLPPAEPPPQAPPQPSLFDRAGAMLSKGDLPQRLTELYTQHGPEAFAAGVRDLNQAVQKHLQTEVEDPTQGPQWAHLPELSPALRKVLGGAGTTALPMAYGGLAAHPLVGPLMALVGGIAGSALSFGGDKLASKMGADPDTAALMGDLAGFIQPEHLAMAALPFAPFARNALTKVLGEVASQRVAMMLKDNPALASMVDWMHPAEVHALSKMTPEAQADALRVHQALPGNELLGALGRGGIGKQGWYEHSRAAIEHVYGDDANLFAGILAATSPQNSVEDNLTNATAIYRGWVQAGRPTDQASIIKVMAQNVLGSRGEQSILPSWRENTVRVLQGGQAISGPKVDSFWRNLRSRAVETPWGTMRPEDAVTLDAWMSSVLGVDQTYFAGQGASGTAPAAVRAKAAQMAAMNPGYGPGYLAAAARMREAATHAGMTPEQMQETIWSWGKALYEQSERTKESAVDIIARGGLDPSAISGTPDFSTLFQHPKYHDTIAGTSPEHAARLATLQPASFPTLPMATPADRQWQLKAAAVLDRLQQSRDIGSGLRVGWNQPGTVGLTLPQEGVPGLSTGVMPELFKKDVTQGQRDTLGRELLAPYTDVRGENVLLKALMLPTTETTRGTGRWKPKRGQMQFNTMDASGARVGYQGGQMNEADANKVMLVAHLQGLLDAQDAVGTTGVVYDMDMKDTLHIFTKNKVKGAVYEGLSKKFADTNQWALVNKGGGNEGHVIDLIRIDGQPVTDADYAKVQRFLTKGLQRPGAGPPKVAITPATNQAGSFDVLPQRTENQAVTKFSTWRYDSLSPAEKAALDTEVKAVAAYKLKVLDRVATRKQNPLTIPPAYRQMLQLANDGGVGRLRSAVADPAQLLPSLLLLGLVRSAFQSPTSEDTASDSSS